VVNGKPLVYLEKRSNEKIKHAGQVILVECSKIEITNLRLSSTDVGIELLNCDNCKIKSSTISKNVKGIYLLNASNNEISENNVSNNVLGLQLEFSSNNTISGNVISGNKEDGILLLFLSNNNKMTNNIVSNNKGDGICIWFGSTSNEALNNIISNNGDDGIDIEFSSNNTISGNSISKNGWAGVYIAFSCNNTIYLNSFVDNAYYNACDVRVEGFKGKNYWDNGTIGNYWDDYNGTDLNGDGIGDTPYPIPPGFDHYPIVDLSPPEVDIEKPHKGRLYILNHELWPTLSGKTIIIGSIDIEVIAKDKGCGIHSVEFYIDGIKRAVYYAFEPEHTWRCTWHWDGIVVGEHTIRVVVRDRAFYTSSAEMTVFMVCLPFM